MHPRRQIEECSPAGWSNLSIRSGVLKRLQLAACRVDSDDARIRRQVNGEAAGIEYLWYQTHIGDGGRVTVTEPAGCIVSHQPAFQRAESKLYPMPVPGLTSRL